MLEVLNQGKKVSAVDSCIPGVGWETPELCTIPLADYFGFKTVFH